MSTGHGQVTPEAVTHDGTWRDWHYGDEPCTYSGGCSEPLRSHYHLNPGPGRAVAVIYYDQPLLEQAYRMVEKIAKQPHA